MNSKEVPVFKSFDTGHFKAAEELLSQHHISHRVLPFRDTHTPHRQHSHLIMVAQDDASHASQILQDVPCETFYQFTQDTPPTIKAYYIVSMVVLVIFLIIALIQAFTS